MAFDSEYIPLKTSQYSNYPDSQDARLSGPPPYAQAPLPAYGVPRHKPRVDLLDALAVFVSLICFIISALVVAPRLYVSWQLGFTNQLIVIGFLLSIMTICLRRVTPTLALLIEARFGRSSLQNFEAIIASKFFKTGADIWWPFVLVLFVSLPIGLSVGYKQFTGGISSHQLHPSTDGNSSIAFGMFGPWGVTRLGSHVGVSLMVNASIPFMQYSQDEGVWPSNAGHGWALPHPYGFNTLLLSKNASALLDAPEPNWVHDVQSNLTELETWTITADVAATVARFDQSRSNAETARQVLETGSLYPAHVYNGYQVDFLYENNNGVNSDESFCILSLAPSRSQFQYPLEDEQSFDDFVADPKYFKVTREKCQGTWTITSSSIEIETGSCEGEVLPSAQQRLFANTTLAFENWYLPTLAEYVGQFTFQPPIRIGGNQSEWLIPTMATTVAGMWWSRQTGNLNGTSVNQIAGVDQTFAGTFYNVNNATIFSHRGTMDGSNLLLYLLLGLQPILTVVFFLLTFFFHNTPLDKGFGLISVLAGVDRASLDYLQGAALSGTLSKKLPIKITTAPGPEMLMQEGLKGKKNRVRGAERLVYKIGEHGHSDALKPRWIYG